MKEISTPFTAGHFKGGLDQSTDINKN